MSWYHRSLCALFLILQCSALCGQHSANGETEGFANSLAISLGLNDLHIKDEYLTPYILRGMLFSSSLSYQRSSGHSRHAVDFFYGSGQPESDFQSRDITEEVARLSYRYTHVLDNRDIGGVPFRTSLGGGISSFIANTDYNEVNKITANTFYDEAWYWSNALNLLLRGAYLISEQRSLSIEFRAPVFSLVSRPENGHYFNNANTEVMHNFINAAKQGKPEFLWDNFVLHAELEYRQRLSTRFSLSVGYSFVYVSSDRPLPMGMYMNDFVVGFLLLF